MTDKIVVVAANRSPIGALGGSLSRMQAHEIGKNVVKEMLRRAELSADQITEVIVGQVITAGCGQNPARQLSINSGIPIEIPAWGVNQVCGSGLKAVALGMNSVLLNDGIVIAGGQECMSRIPHALFIRNGLKLGNALLTDLMLADGLTDAFENTHMGITAENISSKYNISREDQDKFAYNSHVKAGKATDLNLFVNEMIPINVKDKDGERVFDFDESVRRTNLDKLKSLRSVFKKDGTVTAGNSSSINDGAAFVILMRKSKAKELGLHILATIESFVQIGVEPSLMGIGPIPASKLALDKANLKVGDLNCVELNEAFAAQAIYVNREMGWRDEIVNINGGAIAIGHPIGASGARILVTLIHNLLRAGGGKGLATLCVGGGMGVAMCISV